MGDYIVFIDLNDWFELDAIETKYNIFQDKDLDMVRFYYQINGIPQTSYTNVEDFVKDILFKEEKRVLEYKIIRIKNKLKGQVK